ncbi:MAG: hypothetical protein ACFCUO_06565 [Rhodospirillales bacterium]
MSERDTAVIQTLLTATALGAAAGLTAAALVVGSDTSAIGSLLAASADNPLLTGLLIGGSMTKGATLGFAAGIATLVRRPRAARAAAPRMLPGAAGA